LASTDKALSANGEKSLHSFKAPFLLWLANRRKSMAVTAFKVLNRIRHGKGNLMGKTGMAVDDLWLSLCLKNGFD
jgi:hypothetical protein